MELNESFIQQINKKCPYHFYVNEQGIFVEPYGIPSHIKTPVIYMRWSPGGISGGSYHEDSCPRPYTNTEGEPPFDALDIVLKEIAPSITYLQYKDIQKLIHTNSETEYEYYGNCTDFDIKYVIFEELANLINSFK